METWTGLDSAGLAEVRAWLAEGRAGDGPRKQHPVDELIAEHRIMVPALLAIESEIRYVTKKKDLRYEIWELIVEIIGNFLHTCHRKKEEEALFPAVVVLGWKERDEMGIEHGRAERSTHAICEAISDGDWEMTVRLASAFAYGMRRHFNNEETGVLRKAKAELPPDVVTRVRALFDQIEANAIPAGRKRLVEILKELAQRTGVDPAPYGLG